MSRVLQQILEWSQARKRLPWQRDALRRIVEKGTLTEQDITELASICREEAEGVPLDESHLPSAGESHDCVALLSVSDTQNINALAPGTPMKFAPAGLTVIYGDNASGKSGYSRILKQVCRTREREVILPNVFAANPEPQKAKITYSASSRKEECEWTAGTAAPQKLGQVSVFDAHCGERYVDQRNPVEFVPFGLDLFDKLGDVYARVKAALQRDIDALPPADDLDDLQETEGSRASIQSLRLDTSAEEVSRMGTLTAEEKERYALLVQHLAQDPKKKREELDRKIARLRPLPGRLTAVGTAFSQENIQRMRQAQEELNLAARATEAASKSMFGASVLDGVGSEVWRKLWDAAIASSLLLTAFFVWEAMG